MHTKHFDIGDRVKALGMIGEVVYMERFMGQLLFSVQFDRHTILTCFAHEMQHVH